MADKTKEQWIEALLGTGTEIQAGAARGLGKAGDLISEIQFRQAEGISDEVPRLREDPGQELKEKREQRLREQFEHGKTKKPRSSVPQWRRIVRSEKEAVTQVQKERDKLYQRIKDITGKDQPLRPTTPITGRPIMRMEDVRKIFPGKASTQRKLVNMFNKLNKLDTDIEKKRTIIDDILEGVRKTRPEEFATFETKRQAEKLPEGITEEDLRFTMQQHGLTREEVLERLKR